MADDHSPVFWRDLLALSGERMLCAPSFARALQNGEGEMSLFYLSSGSGNLQQNGRRFLLRAHDVFLLLSGCRAQFQAAEQGCEAYLTVLAGAPALEKLTALLSITPAEPLLRGICNPNFLKYVRILSHLYAMPTLTDRLRFQAALYQLCAILLEEFSSGCWQRLRYGPSGYQLYRRLVPLAVCRRRRPGRMLHRQNPQLCRAVLYRHRHQVVWRDEF